MAVRRGTRSGSASVRSCVARLAARGVSNGAHLDPMHERALLDKARREGIEMRMAIQAGEYVRLFDVEAQCPAS